MSRISGRLNIAACVGFALLILLPVGRAEGASVNEPNLLELAEEKIGQLSKVEEGLFKAVANGDIYKYRDKKKENNDPNNVGKWGNERLIRGKCIEWMCANKEALELVTHNGIQIVGARIDERLNLKRIKAPFPLIFAKSAIPKGINLLNARIQMLSLQGTQVGPINANSLKVEDHLFLCDGFKAEGEVKLVAAAIGGHLNCKNGQFINADGKALKADFLKVDGSVFLCDGFKAEGEVRLLSATIYQVLDCNNGQFINPDGTALNADGIKVEGSILLRNGFKANGEVNLRGADIEGQLNCKRGKFIDPNGRALICDSVKVGESILLSDGFKAEGEVYLTGATIGGQLGCRNAQFINPDSNAIIADELKVVGNVLLDEGFKAQGKVRLHTTTIGGDLNCSGGQFINPKGEAIDGDSLKVKGNVFLRKGFKAEGVVYLVGATIGGQLACTGGQFLGHDGSAINAESIKIDQHVFLNKRFKAEGKVNLFNAEIGGTFVLLNVESPKKVTLDLRSATIGTLWDEQQSWPENGRYFLNGLTYSDIFDKSPKDVKTRIEWIRRQYDPENKKDFQFRPQPYEQLAAVLKKTGNDNDAKEVLIAKNKDRLKWGPKLTFSELWWYRIFGPQIGYGHKPLRSFRYITGHIVFGWWLFWILNRKKYIRSISNNSPKFNSLVYSIDTFVPLVDLYQAKYRLPESWLFRLCHWWLIAFGWILTTLFIVGLTGLVRT